jgi:hypothetical protein
MNRLIFSALLVFMSACGGVSSRIKENQHQFDGYPLEIQAQIQNGRVDRGFTEEMVYMAKGTPDDKQVLTRGGKKVTVWRYARRVPPAPPGGGGTTLSTPYGYPAFGPGPSQPTPIFYDKGYFKVEFENGKVIGWDQEMQDDLGSYK